MAWIEALSRSSTILHDIAHVLTHANKQVDGVTPDPAKNWSLLFPSPVEYGTIVDVADERHIGEAMFTVTHPLMSNTMPVAARKLVPNGGGGFTTTTLLITTDYTVDYALGKFTILTAVAPTDQIGVDYSYINPSVDNALAQITDRAVLRTTTTAATVPEVDETYGTGGTTVASITTHLELQMPRNLINPETNTPDYKDLSGLLRGTDRNRHYLQMRVFEQWDAAAKSPVVGTMASEWAKLAWFRDFREILSTDALNQSPAITSRPFFTQTHIAVNLSDMPVQFWIRADNNAISGIIAGDPSIDPDNGLTSFFYVGQIDPVEVGQADVIGNFALITSSSTLPTATADPPTATPTLAFVDATPSTNLLPGTVPVGYVASYTTDSGESPASRPYMHEFTGDRRVAIQLQIGAVPLDARTLRLYRNTTQAVVIDKIAEKLDNYSVLTGLTDYLFTHNLTTFNSQWVVSVARERLVPQQYGSFITFGPEYVVPAVGYVMEGAVIRMAVSEINNVPAVANATGRFRLRVTTKIQDPTVRYGDGSSWELVFETTDISSTIFIDNGLTGDIAFKPYQTGRPNPGVRRDLQGRVISSFFPTRWGPNTATGVLDIAMFKTKSGAPFQKHQASFVSVGKNITITALNPSRWTGKVHLSPIWVVHPYDGYRGKLRDVLVVPRKNLVHLDELIVDKTLPTEKHYKFFRVSAPFSVFNSSPYQQVGVALRIS